MPVKTLDANLVEPLWRHATQTPDRPLFAYRRGSGFTDVTAREAAGKVTRIAAGLIALGVQPGDRVALMCHTRLEWTYIDFAVMAAGGVTVPIYETSSADQVEWILSDSGAVLLFVETQAHFELFRGLATRVPDVREAFLIDGAGIEDVIGRGVGISDDVVRARSDAVTPGDLATLVYTSGTTGRPKGCMLTHGNLRSNTMASSAALDTVFQDGDSTLLFLPLAHSFAKIVALVMVERGLRIGYATDTVKLLDELPLFQPTLVVAVPRVFERVFNKAQHKAAKEGKGRIFDAAAATAIAYSRATAEGDSPGFALRVRHGLFDALVYGKLRAVFGGRLRYAVSGGAPLGERLGHFFRGVGITILEGYGLTETSPVITATTPEHLGVGTVGRPIAGTELRFADDGEILCKGPQVFAGYWHNEAATREMIDPDGWLHTGDIGDLDEDGRLRITGRIKDIIVTAGGKNVAPTVLEDRLRGDPLISDSIVVGDQRPFIAALVALDAESLEEWATEHGRAEHTADALRDHPVIQAHVAAAVATANEAVSQAEKIRAFEILPADLSVETGELTPTLKVRRAAVAREYAELIEKIYSGGASAA
jgi:long-chain acyl-CoA synthetase